MSAPEVAPVAAPEAPPEVDASKEVTGRAIAVGVLFGAIFGAANAYLGLRVGMTVATSIPVSVMSLAVLRAFGARASVLEINLAQTIGSASTALATGAIFTVPALYLWGRAPGYFQIVGLTLLGGILGVSAMIPLRKLLIVRQAAELPYPEGRACAEVLRATASPPAGQADARPKSRVGRWIFLGLGLGAAAKLAIDLLGVTPSEITMALPRLPNGALALEIAPALVAVGYILGPRQASVVVSGSVISALLLIPVITATLAQGGALPALDAGGVWKQYVRYIGAGAVACAGIVTVLRGLPAMVRSLASVARGLRRGGDVARVIVERDSVARVDRDVPGWMVVAGVSLVVLAVAFVPGLLGPDVTFVQRLVCAVGVGVFGLLFVAVASRIVGLVGVSSQPTSGICLVTLLGLGLVFAAAGWTSAASKAAILCAGAIVAVAASKAGDISQDLKTGQLVGATPARQQLGQYLGAMTSCWAVAATLLFLGATSTFGSKELPAPQATLMKTVIEGGLDGSLPWELILGGAGLALAAMLAGVEGLAFAIGVYLPLGSMTPIFVGGLARRYVEWQREQPGHRIRAGGDGTAHPGHGATGGTAGILAASGLVAGEGLAGVAVAAAVGGFGIARPSSPLVGGAAGTALACALVIAILVFLARAGLQPDETAASRASRPGVAG